MSEQALWQATPAQSHYINCTVYEVLYAGERGSGKTDGFLMEPLVKFYGPAQERFLLTGRKTRAWVLFLRKELGRLKELIDRANEMFPQIDPQSRTAQGFGWSAMEKMYRFTNGMKVEFGHLDDPKSHLQYHGRQFVRVGIDEAPEIPEYQVAYMRSCIRVGKSDDEPYLQANLGIRLTGNPYGPYVQWVKKRFIEPMPPNTVLRYEVELPDGSKATRERVFIPSYLKDNEEHIDYASYASSLADLPEPMKQAFLYGNWEYTPGAYFEDFDERIHVRRNIVPPSGVPIQRMGDWGSRAPACCHWFHMDSDGNMIVLDELYGPGIDGPTWGEAILARERRWGWDPSSIDGYLDPQAFGDRDNAGPSPADQMLQMGVSWFPSDKSKGSVLLGAIEMTRRLRARTPIGMPGITIDSRCKHLIEQIKRVKSKEDNPDEFEEMREDHAWESLRAGLLANPLSPEVVTTQVEAARWERLTRMLERSNSRRANDTWS